jgi:DNA-binding transcriptional ArsR family regulator
MTLATQSTIPHLTASIASALSEQTRLNIVSLGNTLVLPDDANEVEIKHVIGCMGLMQSGIEKSDAALRYNIGRAVMALASCNKEKQDIEEAIDAANLPQLLKRSAKTIGNWAYVARMIPPEELRDVSWTVLSEAAAALPSDPAAIPEYKKKRVELLDEAAEKPEEMTAKKIRERIKEIKTQLNPSTGAERPVRESTNELLLRYVKLSRLASVAHSGQLREIGFDSHGVLVDMIQEIDNELVNRDALEADPLADSFYWIKKTQEAQEICATP